MPPHHFATAAVLGMLATAGSACASRDVPASYPKASAASPEAPAAPAAVVTTALQSDPPLPGAPTQGWVGLGGQEATGQQPAGHTGHGAHQHDHGAHDGH